jgi:hypothetical protein
MKKFQDDLEREGVDLQEEMEWHLPIEVKKELLKKNLIVPRLPKQISFAETQRLLLEADPTIRVMYKAGENGQSCPECGMPFHEGALLLCF